jgi:hypothetical protein
MVEATQIKITASNGIACLPNFVKIYQFVHKLLGGTHGQTGDLTSLLPFLESRLKRQRKVTNKIPHE